MSPLTCRLASFGSGSTGSNRFIDYGELELPPDLAGGQALVLGPSVDPVLRDVFDGDPRFGGH